MTAILKIVRKYKIIVEDWKYEVSNGDTMLGYAAWYEHKKESEEE
jgi:hypothetical protein